MKGNMKPWNQTHHTRPTSTKPKIGSTSKKGAFYNKKIDEYSNSNFEDEADHYQGVTNHQSWNKREGETHPFLAAPMRRTPRRNEAWEQQGYEFYEREDAKAYFKWQELMEELFVSYNYTDQRKFTTAIQYLKGKARYWLCQQDAKNLQANTHHFLG
ncbi:unnamed protein product [Arabis nemorensis]|uniref:Retrotransposon gag domain-containing protein n=1 Tax=Arabis nemorensis TaxID=586526 RepID=A0A565CCQ0_9BRAS|nr:unnamed protein product [Arabis nemorensis]